VNGEIGARDWPEFANAPLTEAESDAIRVSIRRDRPYGTESWTRSTAARLGLQPASARFHQGPPSSVSIFYPPLGT